MPKCDFQLHISRTPFYKNTSKGLLLEKLSWLSSTRMFGSLIVWPIRGILPAARSIAPTTHGVSHPLHGVSHEYRQHGTTMVYPLFYNVFDHIHNEFVPLSNHMQKSIILRFYCFDLHLILSGLFIAWFAEYYPVNWLSLLA